MANKPTSNPLFCLSVSSLLSFLQAFRLCRMATDDRSSDILKLAAFAKLPLLYKMRPSSTKLKMMSYFTDHTVYFSMRVCVCIYVPADISFHGCFFDTMYVLYVGIQEKKAFNLEKSTKPSQSAEQLNLRNFEIFH